MFATLLCLKHIYLYLAPAYCVYLLRVYCLGPKSVLRLRVLNILKLGTGLLAILGASFGPFIYLGQTEQLLSRLFPFSRGLCHAYWAPNFWAMYAFTDRLLIYGTLYFLCYRETLAKVRTVAPRLGMTVDSAALNSTTRGLVGTTTFAVLPNVTPRVTFGLTLFFQIVGNPTPLPLVILTMSRSVLSNFSSSPHGRPLLQP